MHIVGEAAGVREGGVLETQLFTLHVRCLPADVPEHIEVDVSALAVGESLKVGELPATGAFEILNDPDAVVATIAAPVSEEELEAMEAAVAAGAPEVAEPEQQPAAAVPEEGEPPSEESPAGS